MPPDVRLVVFQYFKNFFKNVYSKAAVLSKKDRSNIMRIRGDMKGALTIRYSPSI